MTCECQGRRSPPAGPGTGRPASRLSLLVGLAESFSSTLAAPAAEGSSSRSPTARSPRSFDYEGAVGLGIVAAMNGRTPHPQTGGTAISRTPRTTVAPRRSQPIPIVSARPDAFGVRRKDRRLDEEEEEMEMSESYTCVISHVGGGAVSKRVYFDDGAGDPSGCCPEVFFDSPPPRPALLPAAGDFLSRCFRCSKDLHDVDIFMYRGDKAFCSAECRCQQIISDEQRGNWLPDGLKTFDCSVSPCSAPLLFAAGVAAA